MKAPKLQPIDPCPSGIPYISPVDASAHAKRLRLLPWKYAAGAVVLLAILLWATSCTKAPLYNIGDRVKLDHITVDIHLYEPLTIRDVVETSPNGHEKYRVTDMRDSSRKIWDFQLTRWDGKESEQKR